MLCAGARWGGNGAQWRHQPKTFNNNTPVFADSILRINVQPQAYYNNYRPTVLTHQKATTPKSNFPFSRPLQKSEVISARNCYSSLQTHMTPAEHWNNAYTKKDTTKVGWYEANPETSIAVIAAAVAPKDWQDISCIDVGGGTALLGQKLIGLGVRHMTVLDISSKAIEIAKTQTTQQHQDAVIDWKVGDVTTFQFKQSCYDVWHDRAVFHFLTGDEQRKKYLLNAASAIKEGGHLIIGTFSLKGPTQCSNLPVVQYSHETLQQVVQNHAPEFEYQSHFYKTHTTPAGSLQEYVWVTFKKKQCCVGTSI